MISYFILPPPYFTCYVYTIWSSNKGSGESETAVGISSTLKEDVTVTNNYVFAYIFNVVCGPFTCGVVLLQVNTR